MATDDLRQRLERFRTEYREAVEASDALAARVAPNGDAERWLRSAARREQEALLHELRAEQPRPRHAPARPAGRTERSAPLTPDDFAVRTMGR